MPPKGSRKRPRADSIEPEPAAPEIPPTIFASPGLKPDVRLNVFDEEIHVHSLVLKLHSNFFRRFLDERHPPKAAGKFTWDYCTVVDEDGAWGLEPVATAKPVQNQYKFMKDPIKLTKASFVCLLKAMYNRPYQVSSTDNLKLLVSLADYYCAMPIVSATLTPALLASPMFTKSGANIVRMMFALEVKRLLILAKQVRNAALFRECFVHVVGHWDPTRKDKVLWEHPDILQLVQLAHGNLCRKVMDAQQQILLAVSRGMIYLGPTCTILNVKSPGTQNTEFYRVLKGSVEVQPQALRPVEIDNLINVMDELLENNLVLDQTGKGPEAVGDPPYLLCAQIKDEDMPWDTDEIDW